jgi:origin recognition complex subunit 1
MTPNQEIYYNLFEWANDPETKLCFIIIANTMDFPEKLMPKITSRMGSRRLVFAPYSQKQIQEIIE